MIDHEELLKAIEHDLLAAGLDPVKHLSDHSGRRCKECAKIRKPRSAEETIYLRCGLSPHRRLTGGEFACKAFEARI